MKRSIFNHRRHHSLSDDGTTTTTAAAAFNDDIMAPPALNTLADDPYTGAHHSQNPRHNQRRQIFPRTNYDHTQQQHHHQSYGIVESHSQAPTTRQGTHHNPQHQHQRSLFGTSHNHRNSDTLLLMEKTTIEFLGLMESDSLLFSPNNPPDKVPSFHKSEVIVDGILGMGEFGIVMKVTGINKAASSTTSRAAASTTSNEHAQQEPPSLIENETTITSTEEDEEEEEIAFLRMKQKCQSCTALTCLHDDWLDESTRSTSVAAAAATSSAIIAPPTTDDDDDENWFEKLRLSSNNFTNLAIKQLRKDLYPKKKIEAAKDLAREAKFLASLHHPNIVGLKGLVSIPGRPDFGIIIDKLSLTLDEQTKIWKQQCLDSSQFIFPWQSQQRIAEFQRILLERVAALRDVARAIRYLHQKMILFRDLKPENCGQSSQSTGEKVFQIYDFGLAKELKPIDRLSSSLLLRGDDNDIDQHPRSVGFSSNVVDDDSLLIYRATGLTGTLRIMAPEVIQCQPYGLKADIYSFGIVMYEVFAGERCQLTAAEICKGQRPTIPAHMSHPFNDLLVDCWSAIITKRPSIETICKQLELEYDRLNVVLTAPATSSKSSSSSSITTTTATTTTSTSSSSSAVVQQQQ